LQTGRNRRGRIRLDGGVVQHATKRRPNRFDRRRCGGFIQADTQPTVANQAQVDLRRQRMLDDGSALTTDIDRDGVEERVLLRRKAQASQTGRQRRGATMHVVGNAAQPFRAMVDGIHRCHHRT